MTNNLFITLHYWKIQRFVEEILWEMRKSHSVLEVWRENATANCTKALNIVIAAHNPVQDSTKLVSCFYYSLELNKLFHKQIFCHTIFWRGWRILMPNLNILAVYQWDPLFLSYHTGHQPCHQAESPIYFPGADGIKWICNIMVLIQ